MCGPIKLAYPVIFLVPIPSQESEKSCICVLEVRGHVFALEVRGHVFALEVSTLPLSTIVLLAFRNVPIVNVFFFHFISAVNFAFGNI